MKKILVVPIVSGLALIAATVTPAAAWQQPRPSNDTWRKATVIAWPTAPAFEVVEQSVAGARFAAVKHEPTPSCASAVALQTVWFKFTYTASPGWALLVLSTLASDYDTVLAAYVQDAPASHHHETSGQQDNKTTSWHSADKYGSHGDDKYGSHEDDRITWHEVACNDDHPNGTTSDPQSIMFITPLSGTNEYYVQVGRKVNGTPNGIHLALQYNNY